MGNVADGTPTKAFFVEMLTRDIDLNDAILDLLDNCLDGVVRQKGKDEKRSDPDYYDSYYSHITIRKNMFIIEDNCGGIPRDVAEKYAFRMGRSSEKLDDELPTVGIYGIGMKRAIFKIGRSATITTQNDSKQYEVSIPIEWTNSSDDWSFPITDLPADQSLTSGGTVIKISNINSSIQELWDTEDKLQQFIDDLVKSIQQSYSFIIQRGFEIQINGQPVSQLPISLLVGGSKENAIQPFLYKQTFGDVNMSLAVGFYAPPPSPDELDDSAELKRSSSDAGWTVVCNDRVVLYNDKSHLTGWGEAGVPQYHTQFIGIRGIVIFESNNPKSLPMTTTKRGIDTSSAIYAATKDKMRQGLKMFTDYTNRWKGRNNDERAYSNTAKSVSINDLTASKEKIETDTPTIKFRASGQGFVFSPKLPKPQNDTLYRRICYNKGTDEIAEVIEFIYKDKEHLVSPSQVGEKCFDLILKDARDQKEGG